MDQLNQIVDPTTGLPLGQALWQQIALSLFGIAAIIISVVTMMIGNAVRKYLPAKAAQIYDERLKKNIHDAGVTIARKIILEGRNPVEALGEGVDYMKSSAKEAYEAALKTRSVAEVEKIFGDIFLSKVQDLLPDSLQGMLPQRHPR